MNVSRFFSELRRAQGSSDRQDNGRSRTSARAPVAHHAATLFVRRPEDLGERQATYLKELREPGEEVSRAYGLTKGFCAMLRRLGGKHPDAWMESVEESDVVELRRFAQSPKKDEAAARAGLTLAWSQGQTEGQVRKLKLVKRQGYGRAGFELLRSRVLRAA
jgi:transposase